MVDILNIKLWFQEVIRVCSVGGSSERLHLDTADTLSIDGSDLDVTFVTPGSTPGVSHDVVVFTTLGSVSNSGDGVIKVGTASSGVENTAVVHLEDRLVSLDGHSDNILLKGSFELGYRVSWNPGGASDGNLTSRFHSFVASARSSMSRGVWVGALKSLWG